MNSSSRSVLFVAALGLVAGLCAAPSDAAPATATAGHGAAVRTVGLLTGDTVVISGRGAGTRMAVRGVPGRRGAAASSSLLRVGDTTYAVPAVARRYLGTILDPSLFDIAGVHPARLPVALTLTSATARPAVPGLVITSRAGASAQGYLDAAQARAFGDALARQWRADTTAHRVATSILGGLRHLAVAGVRAPSQPNYPQVTLVLKALDAHGRPAQFGLVALLNVDNGRKYNGFVVIQNGQARVSVPKGHYSLVADFDDSVGDQLVSEIVPVADFAVTTDKQAFLIEARRATVTPSVSTPRPATTQILQLEWDRAAGAGSAGFSFGFGPDTVVKVAPTEPSVYGTTEWLTQWTLAATPASGSPYTYDLSFHDSGVVPADQSRTVAAFQLATVQARYYTDGRAGFGEFGRTPFYPFQFVAFGVLLPFQVPTVRTEYVYNSPGAIWFADYIAPTTSEDSFDATFVFDDARRYTQGSQVRADWLNGALTPGVPDSSSGYFCYFCRTDTELSAVLYPVTDSDPGHSGLTAALPRFRVWRDGKSIFDKKGYYGADLTVPRAPATYRVLETIDNASTGALLSTRVSTDVTFRSGAGDGVPLPTDDAGCDFTGDCLIQPVLTARVPLPTGLDGTAPAGPASIAFTAGHIQGAADPALTGVHFLYSVNGGSYVAAAVSQVSAHHYRAVVDAPRGSVVSTRVVVDDAAGGHLVQTAVNAYRVATS